MRNKLLYLPLFSIFCGLILVLIQSCNDETSKIGTTIAPGEVTIYIDSLSWNLNAITEESFEFDSKSGNLLLGRIDVPEYGTLECSFLTRFMPVPELNIPDSLFSVERVDSCKFTMLIPFGQFTGDSLAPQKVAVYKLNQQIPSDINNLFDPAVYYTPSDLLGTSPFVLSNVSLNDSVQSSQSFLRIDVPLKKSFGESIFESYKNNPEIFQWPQTMTDFLPGFYVKQSFGKGCVANITNAFIIVYYNHKELNTVISNQDTIYNLVNRRDSVVPFIVSPEVLSSNNVTYSISQEIKERVAGGETILTTPCGYKTSFDFPVKDLIERYQSLDKHLSTVSDLLLSIPGKALDNDKGISCAPNLLLIKTDLIDDFFSSNNIPDGETSFLATYDSVNKRYQFASLREYLVNMLSKNSIEESDTNFSIIPVDVSYETEEGFYGSSTYVTKCVPYTVKPTVTHIDTENATIIFSFSSQMID